ncbi:MAG: GNAT family N-acetyltransferase [Clostridia bacterium]|nr:GNAT family N-acetyltransferase [Clostridia bacterium]
MLKLIPAEVSQVDELVKISEAAFLSDGTGDGPPEFTNIDWHISMLQTGHLFSAVDDGRLIGGAILFREEGSKWHMYVGRIFVDPSRFRMGYGTALMQAIEGLYSDVTTLSLDTPVWNNRTNAFYRKLGYVKVRCDEEFVYYQKQL